MSFTGSEDHDIPLATAAEWTKNYRTANPNTVIAHFFGKDAINTILSQQGCVGIRIYYAVDDNGVNHLILVGADSSGNDLYQGALAERSLCCPVYCSAANPLNS